MRAVITWFNRISAGGLVLIGLAVIVTGILIGMIAWSPTPVWDQWDAAAPEQLGNLLKPHNEHRIAMSRVIFWGDIALGHGTGVINLAFVYIYSALHLGLLVLLARWAWPKASVTQLAVAAAIGAAFFFSGFQFENFGSGFQNQFTGVFFFASSAIGALCVAASVADPWRKILIGVSVLATVLGVFSMANGLLIAPLLVVLALLLNLRATAWIMLAVAVASWNLYFQEYPVATGPGMASTLIKNPFGFIDNVLAYVGGAAPNSIAALNEPFAQKLQVARAFGLVTMLAVGAMAILTLFRSEEEKSRIAVWAAIGLFVFASAAVTALGRGDLGDIAMLASRYGAGTAALWTVVMIWAVMLSRGPVLSLSIVVVSAFSLLLAYTQIKWIGAAQDYKMRKLDAEAALLVNADATPAYLGVYPAPERAPKVAKWLQEKSLAMYYEPWRRLYGKTLTGTGATCAGEVKDVTVLAAASEPTWQVGVTGSLPPEARGVAAVTPEGEVVGILIRGVKGDINSTFFGADDAPPMWGGFIHMKAPRAAELSLQAVDADGRAVCRLDKTIPIKPEKSIKLARPKMVSAPAPGVAAQVTGVFPENGFNEAVGANPWQGRSWGSWGGDDKNKGRISLTANVEGLDRVAIPFVTGPTPGGSRLEVRVDGAVVQSLPAPSDLPRWAAIEVALPADAKMIEVIAEDASSEWGGWVAVGEPHAMCKENCEARACPQTFIAGEVVPGLSGGFVDSAKQEGDVMVFSGWAADTKAGEVVDHVIAVADNNRIVACLKPDQDRPDVAAGIGPGVLKSGFTMRTPAMGKSKLALYSRQSDGSLARLNEP